MRVDLYEKVGHGCYDMDLEAGAVDDLVPPTEENINTEECPEINQYLVLDHRARPLSLGVMLTRRLCKSGGNMTSWNFIFSIANR